MVALGDRRIPFPSDRISSVFLSYDGSVIGFVERVPSNNISDPVRVVVGTTSSDPYSAIGTPIVTNDGSHIAYRANKDEEWFLVVDGRRVESSGILGDPVFSPDETQIGYGARIGQELWWKVVEIPQ